MERICPLKDKCGHQCAEPQEMSQMLNASVFTENVMIAKQLKVTSRDMSDQHPNCKRGCVNSDIEH